MPILTILSESYGVCVLPRSEGSSWPQDVVRLGGFSTSKGEVRDLQYWVDMPQSEFEVLHLTFQAACPGQPFTDTAVFRYLLPPPDVLVAQRKQLVIEAEARLAMAESLRAKIRLVPDVQDFLKQITTNMDRDRRFIRQLKQVMFAPSIVARHLNRMPPLPDPAYLIP